MKLFLLSQNDNRGYDTFSNMVVAAPDEETARLIHPRYHWNDGNDVLDKSNVEWKKGFWGSSSWAREPEYVNVKYIGEAAPGIEISIICSSFHAG